MVTRKDVENQFAYWNATGEGSERMTSGNWRFARHVLFYHGKPYKRCLQADIGGMVMITKDPHFTVQAKPAMINKPGNDKQRAFAYQIWELPDIGVHSRFEGDELTDAELHNRHQFLFVAELAAFIEDEIKPTSGEELATLAARQKLINRVGAMYTRWHNYRVTFGLKWKDLPTLYRDQINDAIVDKIKRYHDPKSVAQRERNHARKVAKAAFELDG